MQFERDSAASSTGVLKGMTTVIQSMLQQQSGKDFHRKKVSTVSGLGHSCEDGYRNNMFSRRDLGVDDLCERSRRPLGCS